MKGIKVFVTTKARPFQPEQFIDVFSSRKEAESSLRAEFPHMRKEAGGDTYSSDKACNYILFIHEKEV